MSRSWWGALGVIVPEEARESGVRSLLDMCGPMMTPVEAREAVDRIAEHMEDDVPDDAMTEARRVLDVTGSYRLLATIAAGVVADEPATPEPREVPAARRETV